MLRTPSHASLGMFAAAGLFGLGLAALPPSYANLLRGAARDALRPGQMLVQSATEYGRSLADALTPNKHSGDVAGLTARLAELEAKVRRLTAEQGSLLDELQQAKDLGPAMPAVARRMPLIHGELVEARVLGDEADAFWRGRKYLSTGASDGIQELALVLDAPHPLLDQGQDAALAPDQTVYAGRTVAGRIGMAGRYSSTLILVTDTEYRGRARLARETPRGLIFGMEGTLKGEGTELCRLDSLPSTEPVSVGDAVYTGAADGAHPVPMYYGTVARAELPPGALRWSIWVKPAVDVEHLRTLHVLRTVVNPGRILAD